MKRNKLALFAAVLTISFTYACNDDSGNSSEQNQNNHDDKCQCNENETCNDDGICEPKTSACNPACDGDEVCKDNQCIPKICGNCTTSQSCTNTGCVDKSEICDPSCIGDQVCINNTCILQCDKPCGTVCCGETQSCDLVTTTCTDGCEENQPTCNGICCDIDQQCIPGFGCGTTCTTEQTECRLESLYTAICCDNGYLCSQEEEACILDCTPEKTCENSCCSDTEECIQKTCTPACTDQQTRCGEQLDLCCNNETQICLYNQCLPKGKSCSTTSDYDFDEFCEPTTHTCVNEEANPNACIVKPETGTFEPVLKWHWPYCLPGQAPSVQPNATQLLTPPVVINMTDDNGDGKINENDIPDVVFVSYRGTWNSSNQVLRVINGKDGSEIATYPDFNLQGQEADLAVAKINHDEYPEIVVARAYTEGSSTTTKTVIVNLLPKADSSGYEMVKVDEVDLPCTFPRIANLDGGEFPSIITREGIIEYIKDTEDPSKGHYQVRCSANAFGNATDGSTIADLDGDGEMEIIGSGIYNKNCEPIHTETIQPTGTVLADLDNSDDHENGRLDVEQIAFFKGSVTPKSQDIPAPGEVHAYKLFKQEDGKFRRELIWKTPMPMDYDYIAKYLKKTYGSYKYEDGTNLRCDKKYYNTYKSSAAAGTPERIEYDRRRACMTGGGPLIVADFDGDGHPDIAQATKWSYVVYNSQGNVLWADFNTKDASSSETGSSVFDFEGDGIAEALYADEENFHIYKGPGSGVKDEHGYCSAEHLIDPLPHYSGTISEYPVIVDVDNDGQSEILIVSNKNKEADGEILVASIGIRCFADANNRWVRTRRIWNQYDYHVTNINEDGTVPQHEEQNWRNKRLNNFRQNVQPGGLFNAPNLVAKGNKLEVAHPSSSCPPIDLKATITNAGSLGARAGLSVKFYASNVNDTGKTGYLGEVILDNQIAPEDSATVTLNWDGKAEVDSERIKVNLPANVYFIVDESGHYSECKEDDNQSEPFMVPECPSA